MKRIALALALLFVAGEAGALPTAGPRSFATVRAAAILTTSYVATTAVDMKFNNQLTCLVNFTIGSLTSAEVKVQYSDDNSTFYDETILVTSAGATSSDEYISPLRVNVYQLSATGTKLIAVPSQAKYARLAIKGTGTVTSSSATIYCYGGAI